MKTHAVHGMGALAVVAGMVLAFAGPALAEGPTSTATPALGGTPPAARIDHLRRECETALDRRVATLGALRTTVSGNGYLTASDKAALLDQIASENDGLGALRARIAGDTDLAALKADCKDIVGSFRVYLLMVPKIHLMVAAAATVQVAQKVTDLAGKLEAPIDRARAAGKDVTQAQQDLDAMKAAAAAGLAAASPVPGLVLALQPRDYPGNRPALEQARQDVKAAHDRFAETRNDARKVIEDLKDLRTPETPTSTAG